MSSRYNKLLSMVNSYDNYVKKLQELEDKLAWKKAVRKNTQRAYEDYLTTYPNGIYIFETKQKIDEFIVIARKKEEARLAELTRKKEEVRLAELTRKEEEARLARIDMANEVDES